MSEGARWWCGPPHARCGDGADQIRAARLPCDPDFPTIVRCEKSRDVTVRAAGEYVIRNSSMNARPAAVNGVPMTYLALDYFDKGRMRPVRALGGAAPAPLGRARAWPVLARSGTAGCRSQLRTAGELTSCLEPVPPDVELPGVRGERGG